MSILKRNANLTQICDYSNFAAISESRLRSPLRRNMCWNIFCPESLSSRWVRPFDHWSR